MTKPLEAAADAMWSEMGRSDVTVSPRLDPIIAAIRAFAENVTDEMARNIAEEIHERDQRRNERLPPLDACDGSYQQFGQNLLRCAILKGIEP